MNDKLVIELYLDLDGVFSDFKKGVKDILNIDIPEGRLPDDQWKQLQEYVGYKIWSRPFFWMDLQALPGSLEMYKYFSAYGPTILTAVPRAYTLGSIEAVTTGEEKKQWIRLHMSQEQAKRVIITKSDLKHTYCKPADGKVCVLIDDLASNISDWEKAGGIGILHTSVENTKKEFGERVLDKVLASMGMISGATA